jgi:hypothetical protein
MERTANAVQGVGELEVRSSGFNATHYNGVGRRVNPPAVFY